MTAVTMVKIGEINAMRGTCLIYAALRSRFDLFHLANPLCTPGI